MIESSSTKTVWSVALSRSLLNEMCAHAREAAPHECCGLIGRKSARITTLYPLRNVSATPLVSYEAAAEELFAAQRQMRERREDLLGIYHSHPRSADPVPSERDVKLAFYPSAIYFIVGQSGEDGEPRVNAFRIYEAEGRWEQVNYQVSEK